MPSSQKGRPRIVLFGHFGSGNFGNEATFQAMVGNVRRLIANAELMCVTTFPARVTERYAVRAIPISEVVVKPWVLRNPLAILARKVLIGIPSELYRWIKAIKTLWHAQMLIVVGTGLLTDSFCIGGWGPYSVFKWSAAAKLSGCRLLFVSAGAGPLDRPIGRLLIKSALALAEFRSYRDEATLQYLKSIGFWRKGDRVFPDLAFSLPPAGIPSERPRQAGRPVVGLGLMEFGGMYGVEKTTREDYSAYTQTLLKFAEWLLNRGYDLRLLSGDSVDLPAVREFEALLRHSSATNAENRIVGAPITSTQHLLSQLSATDFVVATRFHNVLLALLLNKPSIAISFHHKCSSLMSQMGLSKYCQDIKKLNGDRLIEQFCQLENCAESLRQMIRERAADCREALDEQYGLIFKDLVPHEQAPSTPRLESAVLSGRR
jgi:polysaccharide pyruvyl transferase WcaK-like protein